MFATVLEFGVTDRIDLGVVVPFVKLDMHTRVFSRILRTATPPTEAEEHGNAIPIHAFDPLGLSNRTTYASAHARGIGDIVVRGKAQLVKTENGGVAVAVNVSVPTGDEEDLLGTGVLRVEARGIWSQQFGRVGAHLNGGYTTSGGSLPASLTAPVDPLSNRGLASDDQLKLPDEIGIVGGVEVAVAPRVGISGDIIARQLRNTWQFAGARRHVPVADARRRRRRRSRSPATCRRSGRATSPRSWPGSACASTSAGRCCSASTCCCPCPATA